MNQFYNLDRDNIPANAAEVARYLGYPVTAEPEPAVALLIDTAIRELRPSLQPRLVWDQFPLAVDEQAGRVILCPETDSETVIASANLAFNLRGCSRVVLFAATIGAPVDAAIRRATASDPVKASIYQATAAMFVESFVDLFNDFIREQTEADGGTNPARFSPGFGDCSLENQKLFFSLLNCSKIGLTLMDTLIMAPEKSVTAFIGIC
ncbi:MAG: hypothetical protein MJ178_10505 [Treponemataceae bacterium]|nr:hypothetical protein [Treponemataceae bacterium]